MSNKNKNEKTKRQLEIDHLDEMLWRSTLLGKFLSSRKRKASKVSLSGPVTRTKGKRFWVVRIPSSFVFTGAKTGGFQQLLWQKLEIRNGKKPQNVTNGKFLIS